MERAHALLAEGRAEAALSAFDRALAIDPALLDARSARGALLVGLGRIDEGLAEITTVLARRPSDAQAWYNKACAHSLRREGSAALDALVRAVTIFAPYRATAVTDPHLAFARDDPALASRFRAIVVDDSGPAPPTGIARG